MSTMAPTKYVVTPDGFHIAYRTWGQGDLVHLFRPEFGASVDSLGQHPAHIRFERFIGSLSRCVAFDPRGFGSSDPVPPDRLGALDDWVTDAVAVLDGVGADRVVYTGEGYSGQAAVTFAVTHPDRLVRLLLMNPHAKISAADDYAPAGAYPPEMAEVIAESISRDWGTGRVIEAFSPQLVTDPTFIDLCARIERGACSPATAAAMVHVQARSDVRSLLPRVAAPTLVYYSGDLSYVSSEMSRYVADHIPGATFMDMPGRSFYQPDETGQLDAWAEFIVGGTPGTLERKLATIVFVDVVGSTEHAASVGDERWTATLEDLDTWVRKEIEAHGGSLVKQTGDGHLAVFDRPGDAVRTACAVANGVHVLGVEVRCGVHVGEIEVRAGGDIGGIAVHTAARVMDRAGPRQVFVSRTVADLTAGAGLSFEERGSHELKGVPGAWQLFEVKS